MAHPYPGNVRELHTSFEHAFVLLRDGQIELKQLPRKIAPEAPRRAVGRKTAADVKPLEAQTISEALERHGGHPPGARARHAQEHLLPQGAAFRS